jgi:hypothetical protein
VLAGGTRLLEADVGALDVGAGQLGDGEAIDLLRREVTWLERVPPEKRAMNSLSWAIFFSRCSFWLSMRERMAVFCSTMSSYPPL